MLNLQVVGALAYLDHLKVRLAHATFWTDKILGHISPGSTRRNALFFAAFFFVVYPTADNALPLFHNKPLSAQDKSAVRYLQTLKKATLPDTSHAGPCAVLKLTSTGQSTGQKQHLIS